MPSVSRAWLSLLWVSFLATHVPLLIWTSHENQTIFTPTRPTTDSGFTLRCTIHQFPGPCFVHLLQKSSDNQSCFLVITLLHFCIHHRTEIQQYWISGISLQSSLTLASTGTKHLSSKSTLAKLPQAEGVTRTNPQPVKINLNRWAHLQLTLISAKPNPMTRSEISAS